jgi:type I restriction enzyme S subunit
MIGERKRTITGFLPDHWDAGLIKNHSTVVRGASPRPAGDPRYFDGDYLPWITVADVTGTPGMYLYKTRSKLTREGTRYTRIIQPNTLIITNSGATLGVPKITTETSGANDGIAMFLNLEGVGKQFLYYVLEAKTKYFREELAPGIGQPNLNTDLLGDVAIPIPPVDEQEQIVERLMVWDSAIEKAERLIAAKERQHTHELFRHIRSDSSPRSHVGDFANEISERNNGGNGARVLSVTNTRGFVLPEEQFERRVASADLSNYKVVRRGQYAYNPSRINVGSIARLDGWDQGVLSPMYVVFELDESKVDSDYFQHWLSSHEARERIKKSAQGSVRETVSFTELSAIVTPLPDLAKQASIARYLGALRAEINAFGVYAEKIKTQKRGLMQKLLSGEWPVSVSKEKAYG